MEEMDTIVLEVGDIINVVCFSEGRNSDDIHVHTHPMLFVKEVSQTNNNKYIHNNDSRISLSKILKIYSMEGKLIYEKDKSNITIGIKER